MAPFACQPSCLYEIPISSHARLLSLSNGVLTTFRRRPFGRSSKWDKAMLHIREFHDLDGLTDRLRDAGEVNASSMAEVTGAACRRYPSIGQGEKTARLEQLIRSGAWTDAALALIDLELPLWQVRRLAYDDGEWHCALSRERELPDWLDQSIETRHADLALAILSAFVEARRISRAGEPYQRAGREPRPRRTSMSRFAATTSLRTRADHSGAGVSISWPSSENPPRRSEPAPGARSLRHTHHHPDDVCRARRRRIRQRASLRCRRCPPSSAPLLRRSGAKRSFRAR